MVLSAHSTEMKIELIARYHPFGLCANNTVVIENWKRCIVSTSWKFEIYTVLNMGSCVIVAAGLKNTKKNSLCQLRTS